MNLLEKVIWRTGKLVSGDVSLTKSNDTGIVDAFKELRWLKIHRGELPTIVSQTEIKIHENRTPTSSVSFVKDGTRYVADREEITFLSLEKQMAPIYEYLTGKIVQPSYVPALLLHELRIGWIRDDELAMLAQYGVDAEVIKHLKTRPTKGSYLHILAAADLWMEGADPSFKSLLMSI